MVIGVINQLSYLQKGPHCTFLLGLSDYPILTHVGMWGSVVSTRVKSIDGSMDSGPTQELLQKTWCVGSTWMMDSGDLKSKLPLPLEFGNLWFEGIYIYNNNNKNNNNNNSNNNNNNNTYTSNLHQNMLEIVCPPESHENFNCNQIIGSIIIAPKNPPFARASNKSFPSSNVRQMEVSWNVRLPGYPKIIIHWTDGCSHFTDGFSLRNHPVIEVPPRKTSTWNPLKSWFSAPGIPLKCGVGPHPSTRLEGAFGRDAKYTSWRSVAVLGRGER